MTHVCYQISTDLVVKKLYIFQDNEVLGYVGPEVGAKTLVEFLKQHGFSTECRILDVGSGTGLVGEQLKKMNYTSLDGLEPSEKSVEIAKAKKIYKTFYSDFLVPGIRLDIPSDTYDAAICIGVFTLGNVKAEGAMDEMVRVVRPGGLICFSVREDVMFDKEYGHEDKMAELCEKKAWKLLSKTLQQHLSNYSRSTHSYFFVYEVL